MDEAQLAELSPQSKDKAFRHLMNQNALLKQQLDRERAKRAANIKHFREYKAVQDERKALKQRRREERSKVDAEARTTNATPVSSSVPPPSDPPAPADEEPEAAAVLSEPSPLSSAREQPLEPAAPPLPREKSVEVRPEQHDEPRPGRTRSASTASKAAAPTEVHDTPLRRSTTGAPAPSAGAPSTTRQPTRITPWLGGTPSSSKSTRKLSRAGSFVSDEDDTSPMTTPSAKPLVRDRTGTMSLLKTTLQRVATGGGPGSGGEDSGTSTPLSRKRSLDFEGLSPAERAAQRRKLNQMTTAEKREFYAQYKGSGRYLKPEEVARSVADEFEIDPARNHGVRHKYHDVVRARDARKQMHGGDCECCRDVSPCAGIELTSSTTRR